MLAPTGVLQRYDAVIPRKKHVTESIDDVIITLLKVLQTCIDVSAGKIIRLEIRSVPIILIPSTTVRAVSMAITVL